MHLRGPILPQLITVSPLAESQDGGSTATLLVHTLLGASVGPNFEDLGGELQGSRCPGGHFLGLYSKPIKVFI
jgi:hypothetical protein